jgi:hypothetical protein
MEDSFFHSQELPLEALLKHIQHGIAVERISCNLGCWRGCGWQNHWFYGEENHGKPRKIKGLHQEK